jgi:hypothetical protein
VKRIKVKEDVPVCQKSSTVWNELEIKIQNGYSNISQLRCRFQVSCRCKCKYRNRYIDIFNVRVRSRPRTNEERGQGGTSGDMLISLIRYCNL